MATLDDLRFAGNCLTRGRGFFMTMEGGEVVECAMVVPDTRVYGGQRDSDFLELGHELGTRVWYLFDHNIFRWPRRFLFRQFGLDAD